MILYIIINKKGLIVRLKYYSQLILDSDLIMSIHRSFLDDIDKRLLDLLQRDCKISLSQIAEKLALSKSRVHYRIKRLEKEKIIEGYHAKVNLFKLAADFQAIVLIRGKYGPEYSEKVSKALSEIPGVWAIYNVLGEWDFVVLMRAESREDFIRELEAKIESSHLLERTNTTVIARIIKETEKYVLRGSEVKI